MGLYDPRGEGKADSRPIPGYSRCTICGRWVPKASTRAPTPKEDLHALAGNRRRQHQEIRMDGEARSPEANWVEHKADCSSFASLPNRDQAISEEN